MEGIGTAGQAGGDAGDVLRLLEEIHAASGDLVAHCIGNLCSSLRQRDDAKRTFRKHAGVIDDDGSESDETDDETVCRIIYLLAHSLTHSLTH